MAGCVFVSDCYQKITANATVATSVIKVQIDLK